MRNQGGATGPLVLISALLVLLPVLYVLSAGPVGGLYHRGYVSQGLFQVYLAPLDWICQQYQPLQDFEIWYDDLFRPVTYPP